MGRKRPTNRIERLRKTLEDRTVDPYLREDAPLTPQMENYIKRQAEKFVEERRREAAEKKGKEQSPGGG